MYTPPKTKAYEKQIKEIAKTMYKGEPLSGAVCVEVYFYMRRPKTVKREYPTVKPDIDNVEKALWDGLNGVTWKDDAQIVEVHKYQRYADHGHIKVTIEEL